jgi:hypothetical protein
MDIRRHILKEHTKVNCLKIVKWIGTDLHRFNELFDLFLHDEYRVSQRAAWPVSHCAIAHPEFMKKNWGRLISNLHKPKIHDSIKRNTVRLLQSVPIPKKYEGAVMDICFKYVESHREAVAVKAFSLSVLEKLARKYPEIIPEIKYLIEDQLPHQTAAFRSRAKKILKTFESFQVPLMMSPDL